MMLSRRQPNEIRAVRLDGEESIVSGENQFAAVA
jgi:hypothetical protein